MTELERNEYQKIREKSLDEVKADLATSLSSIGYSMSDLEDVFPPKSSYGNQKQENYTMTVKTEDEAKAIYSFDIKGFKATGINYLFDQNFNINHEEMLSMAIADARKKAEVLADNVGKKVGEIISVEDKSSNTFNPPNESRNPTYKVQYNVTIKFQLN